MTVARAISLRLEPTRDKVIALVKRIMGLDYADDDELGGWLDQLRCDLVCPDVSGLIFWAQPELTAAQTVDRASVYQPIEMRSTHGRKYLRHLLMALGLLSCRHHQHGVHGPVIKIEPLPGGPTAQP